MEHPYGWWSLFPPAAAIVLAVVTRRAALSLLAGVFCGALLTERGDVAAAVYDLCEVHLWPTLADPGKLRVYSFTLLMGALIGVLTASGGMQGFVRLIAPLARTRRGGQLTTWGLGLAVFFDDYANTLLLGGTLRPVCDRLRISREKLAYLVDSTAAPVAGLSLLSTWVAVELDYLQEGIASVGTTSGLSALDLFVATIPYRFYVLGALLLIPLIAWSGRDFGPMLAAERRAWSARNEEPGESSLPAEVGREAHGLVAVAPILLTLAVVLALMYATGRAALQAGAAADAPAPSLRAIFGAAQSSLALQYGALAGLLLAGGLCLLYRLLRWEELLRAAGQGAVVVLPAIAILWTASALSRLTGNKSVLGESSLVAGQVETYAFQRHRLYTGDFLARLLHDPQPAADGTGETERRQAMLRWLPTIVFVLASAVSFCTGTSYGTMGLLTPLAISLTYSLLAAGGGPVSPSDPLLLATVGSVLAGAVFGDHCSPISDTTILSAQASGCDVIGHTVTQLPYALSVAAVALLCGTLPAGWGWPVELLLPLQAAALAALVWLVGRRVEASPALSSTVRSE
jgi:Na+/H+ antiporter NhaC